MRLQHFLNGRDYTIDCEMYEVLLDAITEGLPQPPSDADRTMLSMLSLDSLAAGIRAELRHSRYRIEQRAEQIRLAEEHLARLRDGLRIIRDAEQLAESNLVELDGALNELRTGRAAPTTT